MVSLQTIIKMNVIQDNPVTESDLKLMECLFEPDIPTGKGRTQESVIWCLFLTNYVMPNVMFASSLT